MSRKITSGFSEGRVQVMYSGLKRCDQNTLVIEEVVGQLLDVARAELVVSGHGCLGARQHRWLFC